MGRETDVPYGVHMGTNEQIDSKFPYLKLKTCTAQALRTRTQIPKPTSISDLRMDCNEVSGTRLRHGVAETSRGAELGEH